MPGAVPFIISGIVVPSLVINPLSAVLRKVLR